MLLSRNTYRSTAYVLIDMKIIDIFIVVNYTISSTGVRVSYHRHNLYLLLNLNMIKPFGCFLTNIIPN